jgi:hypothetical protein
LHRSYVDVSPWVEVFDSKMLLLYSGWNGGRSGSGIQFIGLEMRRKLLRNPKDSLEWNRRMRLGLSPEHFEAMFALSLPDQILTQCSLSPLQSFLIYTIESSSGGTINKTTIAQGRHYFQ